MKKRVIALGFFDGVHIGHGALLTQAKARADALGALPSVLTFDAHPGQFTTGKSVPLLSSLSDRRGLIRRLYEIGDMLIIPFDESFRQTPWEVFVEALKEKFHGVHVICGHNFHFGYQGAGTPAKLRARCETLGLGCDVVEEISLDGIPVSSTYIRGLLSAGALARANRFLGHPHTLTETVVHGRKLGRTIGIPTINLHIPQDLLIPAHGAYATRVFLPGAAECGHMAVTNIGTRPTVSGGDRVTVECHILDFDGDLYGQKARVEFHQFLRREQKFPDIDALKAQIQQDVVSVRRAFECDI